MAFSTQLEATAARGLAHPASGSSIFMKVYNEQDLRRANWGGLKPALYRALSVRPIRKLAYAVGRRLLPKPMLHRLPVFEDSVEFCLKSGASVRLLDPQVDYVAKDIFWGGGRLLVPSENNILDKVETLARHANVFLDIGSYSGLFALVAARANPHLRAVAYEIVPENYALIDKNIAANGLSGRVQAKLAGLAAAPGTLTMPSKSGSLSHPASLSLGSHFEAGIPVPLTTLDAEGYQGRMLMKIDVEGFEWQVFQGGAATIAALRPDMICEFLPGAPDCDAVQGFLKSLDYRFLLALDHGFEERSEIVPHPTARDWLLTTRPGPMP
jgi:FkbM family methyltransferase